MKPVQRRGSRKVTFKGKVTIFGNKLFNSSLCMLDFKITCSVTDTSKEATIKGLKKIYIFAIEKLELVVNLYSMCGCQRTEFVCFLLSLIISQVRMVVNTKQLFT